MASKRIDWEHLEPALRTLKKEKLLQCLRDAHQALPASRIPSVFGAYVDITQLDTPPLSKKQAAPHSLLEAVQKFHAASWAGQYYESFNVNAKNYRNKSTGTKHWIRECHRLFDQCVECSRRGQHGDVCAALDLLFELLQELDSGSERIIFFADEAGAWQVGIDYEQVLPAYFTSLAAVAEPQAYADRVTELIAAYGSYDAKKLLRAARKIAHPAQRHALRS